MKATACGILNPRTIIIDYGAICKYARRRYLERVQLCADFLEAQSSKYITVCMATRAHIILVKISCKPFRIGFDFNSVECGYELDLDPEFNLILSMTLMEPHELYID